MIRGHVGTGPLLGLFGDAGVEIELASTRGGRWRDFFRKVEQSSDLTYEQIMARLAEDETLRDLVWNALNRAVAEPDGQYRDAVAQLVGAAFDESTRIEESGHLLREMQRLEPVHLRAFRVWFRPRTGTLEDLPARPRAVANDEHDVDFETATLLVGEARTPDDVALAIGVTGPLAGSAVVVLTAAGFIREKQVDLVDHVSRSLAGSAPRIEPKWLVTPWGYKLIRALYPNLEVQQSPLVR